MGAQLLIAPNCGKGVRARATLRLVGKPANGRTLRKGAQRERVIGVQGTGLPPVAAIANIVNLQSDVGNNLALDSNTPLDLASGPARVVVHIKRLTGEGGGIGEQIRRNIRELRCDGEAMAEGHGRVSHG
jgi:hypothetical protein